MSLPETPGNTYTALQPANISEHTLTPGRMLLLMGNSGAASLWSTTSLYPSAGI